MNTPYYEGRGQRGPIRCIMLSIFHPVQGPIVSCQFPDGYLTIDKCKAIAPFLISKPTLHNVATMTINALGHKFIGYPAKVANDKYKLKTFEFNVCFVCDGWAKTLQYDNAVKTLGQYLHGLEELSDYLSNSSTDISSIFDTLLYNLNKYGVASLLHGYGSNPRRSMLTGFHVMAVREDVPPVGDFDVPIMVVCLGNPRPSISSQINMGASTSSMEESNNLDHDIRNDDLAHKQLMIILIPFVNGCNNIIQISTMSKMDIEKIKRCIECYIFKKEIAILPMMKSTNIFMPTPSFERIFSDSDLRRACVQFVFKRKEEERVVFSQIAQVMTSLQRGVNLNTIIAKCVEEHMHVNVQRVITFAMLHNLIVCLKRYPVVMDTSVMFMTNEEQRQDVDMTGINILLNGYNCVDTICRIAQIKEEELEIMINTHPNITFIWS